MDPTIKALTAVVQTNCHIADSRFAGEYTLCVYLLKMREFYRWEKGLPFTHPLPTREVGEWLTEREQLWETLEQRDYDALTVAGQSFAPFDSRGVNEQLHTRQLVYSGGLGTNLRPHFFLADLHRREQHGKFTLYIAGREYARDITAPPAMALQQEIFIRKESLRRMLWEKYEEWRWNRRNGPMQRALAFYPFEDNLDQALEQMTDREAHAALLHEIGEIRAGENLGEEWHAMLSALPRSATELMARAVRDHIADCLSTLPVLLDEENEASLHFYFANLRGMRRELFPALYESYAHWQESGRLEAIREQVQRGLSHWQHVAGEMLHKFQHQGPDGLQAIADFTHSRRL